MFLEVDPRNAKDAIVLYSTAVYSTLLCIEAKLLLLEQTIHTYDAPLVAVRNILHS
jgi:hypothetical protein